jgi:hypothetical protein
VRLVKSSTKFTSRKLSIAIQFRDSSTLRINGLVNVNFTKQWFYLALIFFVCGEVLVNILANTLRISLNANFTLLTRNKKAKLSK